MTKKTAVSVDVAYYPQKIERKRIIDALRVYLDFDGSGTFLPTGLSDLNYVGKLTRTKLGHLRTVIANMRRWDGIESVRIKKGA